jgi:hypothetical protein
MTQDLSPSGAIATVLQTHEQIEFGGSQLSAQDYDRCQQAYGAAERAMTNGRSQTNAAAAQPSGAAK